MDKLYYSYLVYFWNGLCFTSYRIYPDSCLLNVLFIIIREVAQWSESYVRFRSPPLALHIPEGFFTVFSLTHACIKYHRWFLKYCSLGELDDTCFTMYIAQVQRPCTPQGSTMESGKFYYCLVSPSSSDYVYLKTLIQRKISI